MAVAVFSGMFSGQAQAVSLSGSMNWCMESLKAAPSNVVSCVKATPAFILGHKIAVAGGIAVMVVTVGGYLKRSWIKKQYNKYFNKDKVEQAG